MFHDLIGTIHGPLHFRVILQPAMAIFFAVRDGLRDARTDQPAYDLALFTDANHRRERLRNGWRSISKVFIIALILEVIYQAIVIHWFYPFEALLVAVLLALVPYLLVRGPVDRIKRALSKKAEQSPTDES